MGAKKGKIIIWILSILSIAAIISLSFCCVGFIKYIGRNETERTYEYLIDVAGKSAVAVTNKINGYVSSLESLSATVSCYPENDVLNTEIIQRELKLKEFRRIGYIYSDGESIILDSELGQLSGADFREREYYKQAIKGKVFVSAPFDDYWSDKSIVIICVPIYGDDNSVIGVLCGVNNEEVFSESLAQTLKGEAYFHVVDSDGNMVSRSSKAEQDSYPSNVFNAEYEYTAGFDLMRENFAAGKSGISSFKEPGMPEKQVAYTPLGLNDWFFASIMTTSDAQLRIKTIMLYISILMTVLATTLILLIITALKARQLDKADKHRLAFFDKLTGCSNRTKFLIDIQSVINLYDGKHCILAFDIQNFTAFNKIFGYPSGDELIVAISKCLKDNIHNGELLAHSYADRFLLLMTLSKESDIEARITGIFESIDNYMKASCRSGFSLVARCGVYRIQSSDKSVGCDILIDYAISARSGMCELHKSSYAFFNPEENVRLKEAAELESHMYTALQNKEFFHIFSRNIRFWEILLFSAVRRVL